ncbi:MAG TPA: hypothetical protein QF730_08350 [Planctomycetota bacterium]|jgi:hypothetical protein|nr:hypothetical protein [Planctomycetota bacterium]
MEPKPFVEADFRVLSASCGASAEYNPFRLESRRRLLGLGKGLVGRAKASELALEARTSLHNPHAMNRQRVTRQWAYVTRAKAEKARLRKVLGRDLAKDLDAAYRNAYLCLAIEEEALEVSLRIHPEGWYDGQNMVNRIKKEGLGPWKAILDDLEGFTLRMHDWRGAWECGKADTRALEEYLGYYVPGEHRLAVERRWPAPAGPAREAVLGAEIPGLLLSEAERLLPLYRFAAWSAESDHLFSS